MTSTPAIIFGNRFPGRVSTFLLCHHACCDHHFSTAFVPWFSDGFPMVFRWWEEVEPKRTSFLRSCFWGEWNKHTWSHIKFGWKWSSGETKSECFVNMDMWVETEKPWKFSPQKKNVSHHSDESRLVESVRFFVVLESVNTTHHLICATWKLC